jgi:hypothetical protein
MPPEALLAVTEGGWLFQRGMIPAFMACNINILEKKAIQWI